jgi:hypothetical protein
LGAVDESARFFLNGKLTGERFYETPYHWILPFPVRIDQNIDWSAPEQWLFIRVNDLMGGGGIWKRAWIISI